uniref:hypothetical chloroplast RF65 n=1 Tax=Hormidiella parvula TaxID=2058785 RepID=UPI00286BFE22|nr:hypothetical chloroplast RF65 [Hormidiella parvula]YP_010932396.1 hypothetical chloroplast RF65 [Hormidiella parvula]WKT06001.1 hypothetical chloroplast RF65 [Hormidiella parvula]WKT06002.1 hypothetical chloroplast RF65 [Hormidiella parvula]
MSTSLHTTRFRVHPLCLKLVWPEKNIGIAINRLTRHKGPLALTKYFLWPRQDTWEQLRSELCRTPWIKGAQTILLLNQTTALINGWRRWQERQQEPAKPLERGDARSRRTAVASRAYSRPNQEAPTPKRGRVRVRPREHEEGSPT